MFKEGKTKISEKLFVKSFELIISDLYQRELVDASIIFLNNTKLNIVNIN